MAGLLQVRHHLLQVEDAEVKHPLLHRITFEPEVSKQNTQGQEDALCIALNWSAKLSGQGWQEPMQAATQARRPSNTTSNPRILDPATLSRQKNIVSASKGHVPARCGVVGHAPWPSSSAKVAGSIGLFLRLGHARTIFFDAGLGSFQQR